MINGKKIEKEKTLIIFDEIQECPEALNSLKYFCEDSNDYHIVCAGSLLGIRLSHTAFPVGKVDFLNLYPMTFSEFLMADNCQNLVQYMEMLHTPVKIEEVFFYQLEEKLKAYFIVGGMPEVVYSWVNDKDIEEVNKIQDAILAAYENDFAKHTTNREANKISLIWNNIPSQLARENKKFLYQTIKEGARAREYENALNWLNDASLIDKVYHVSKPNLPLKAYHDLSSFKIYMSDVGLLRRMSGLDSNIILEGNKLFEEFKGAFVENYVLNMLNTNYIGVPNYYTFDRSEIDFIIQYKNQIIPIEVKSNKGNNHLSLNKYKEKYNPNIVVKISTNNLVKDGNTINIPLFLVEYMNKFLEKSE